MRKHMSLALAAVPLAASGALAEIIGPFNIQASPVSAVELVGGGSSWSSIGVVNQPVSINDAFSGSPVAHDGYANGDPGTSVEVTFAPGTLVNGAGDDLVFLDAGFSTITAYAIRIDYEGFSADRDITTVDFIPTGVFYSYYYLGVPEVAEVRGAPLDLSFWGVPAGGQVTRVRFVARFISVDPLGFGSLVPAPGTVAAFGLGAAVLLRRRR